MYLKQSTAADVILGPFVDSTDGVTAETALTISQADIRLSKNGAAFAQTNNATGATHRENGNYLIPLDSTDTNTLGRLRVSVAESGALPCWLDLEVVTANVWDSLFSTDLLQVDVTQVSGDTTAADNLEAAADGTGYNLGGGSVVAASVTGAVGSVTGNVGGNVTGSVGSISGVSFPTNFSALGINASGHVSRVTLCDTITTYTGNTVQTGDSFARIGATGSGLTSLASAANLAIVDTVVDSILVDTAEIGAAGAGLTSIGDTRLTNLDAAVSSRSTLSAANVNAEVVDALATDTYAEPGQGAPAATLSLAQKIGYLFKAWRNKYTQSSTEYKLFADDATTVDQKSAVSDDGTTFTHGEVATGP